MKAPIAVSIFAGSLLASTAHAQLFSEVQHGQNFELDDYVTEQRELAPVAPGTQWNANDDVRVAPQTPGGPACYWVPGRLNVERGEAVLSTDRSSLIYELLASLGQTYSHSGMARDAHRIRHNTMQTYHIEQVDGTPVRLRGTGRNSLREGYPGTITHSVEAAVSHEEFKLTDGLVLARGNGGFVGDIQRRTELANAEAEMADFRGWYRLFAYTDMTWRDPYARNSNDGNMCSGSIFHAHLQAGNRGWSWSQRRTYSASVRQSAAALLYSRVRHKVVSGIDGFDAFLLDISDIFSGSAGQGETARAIANQVVNCMAFNDCGNFNPRWQQGVGTGRSLSPDDLYMLTFIAAFNAANSGATNDFAYTTAKPLQKTGEYLCCVRSVQEQLAPLSVQALTQPVRYTQCLRQY